MVVRNAEERLSKLLTQMASSVDEIIVVDQNSTDKTVKIAEKHGAKIIHTTPKGFADPDRDYCYSLATTEWILALDPDETPDADFMSNLRQFVREKSVDVYWFIFDNTVDGVDISEILGPDPHPRLWRRLNTNGEPTLRWPSTAHTHPSINTTRVVYVEKGRINHARTKEEVEKAHSERHSAIHPHARQQEEEFLKKLDELLRKAAPAGIKDAKPKEVDMKPRPVGKRP